MNPITYLSLLWELGAIVAAMLTAAILSSLFAELVARWV